MGLLTDRITNKSEKRNLLNAHAPSREPVALILLSWRIQILGYANCPLVMARLLLVEFLLSFYSVII